MFINSHIWHRRKHHTDHHGIRCCIIQCFCCCFVVFYFCLFVVVFVGFYLGGLQMSFDTTAPSIVVTCVVGVGIVILWRPVFFIRWWQLGSAWYYMKSGVGISFRYIWCSLKSELCLPLRTIYWRGTVGWVGRLNMCRVGRLCVPVATIRDGRGWLNNDM